MKEIENSTTMRVRGGDWQVHERVENSPTMRVRGGDWQVHKGENILMDRETIRQKRRGENKIKILVIASSLSCFRQVFCL